MRLAIATTRNRVSPLFDTARQLWVVELQGGAVVFQRHEPFEHDSFPEKVAALSRLGVQALVCGGISRDLAGMIESGGIQLHPFVRGDVGQVLEAWRQGALPSDAFRMPGCGGRGRRRRRRNRGGRNGFRNRPRARGAHRGKP